MFWEWYVPFTLCWMESTVFNYCFFIVYLLGKGFIIPLLGKGSVPGFPLMGSFVHCFPNAFPLFLCCIT